MEKIFQFVFCALLFLVISCEQALEVKNENMDSTNQNKTYYKEAHRSQFHFTPKQKWMNDPNGMVYYEGEYHLFYQYYPDSTVWGPMHWGHAVSENLVHWEHLPIALYPDSLGLIFSGSAVIDWNNTSGFGKDGQAPMIAIFTHHNMEGEKAGTNTYQYQSIAYSNDKGRTWTKYENNPVIPNPGIKDFRDPKVIWHEDSQQWVMVFAAYDKVRFYNSPNLKDWTFTSEFGIPGDDRLWECPDIFPLSVDGTDKTKWVLITSIQKKGPNGGTATSYFIGDFDGKTFTGDNTKQLWADYGRDNYAMVTWSDIPEEDGRRLAIGWMSNWQYAQIVPTDKWRSAMTLPRVLRLKTTTQGLRMISQPVAELQSIRDKKYKIKTQTLNGNLDLNKQHNLSGNLFEIELELVMKGSDIFTVSFSNDAGENYQVGYDAGKQHFFSNRMKAGKSAFSEIFANKIHTAPRVSTEEKVKLHLFVDVASAELFADDGEVVLTDIFFPKDGFTNISLSSNSPIEITSGTIYLLNRIWSDKK